MSSTYSAKTIELTQLFPDRRQVPLEGLYLDQNLAGISALIGRPIVAAGYITDRNGIVATTNEAGRLQVPPEIRNDSDWALFQEILAQSDLVISGSAYLRRIAATGKPSQDVLYQFRRGNEFEHLGEWRLKVGYERREPDLAFVSHGLDFHIPPNLLDSGRRVFVFTSDAMAASTQAGHLTETGAVVVGSGAEGVEGARMIDHLNKGWGYNVITLATGPGVLDDPAEGQAIGRVIHHRGAGGPARERPFTSAQPLTRREKGERPGRFPGPPPLRTGRVRSTPWVRRSRRYLSGMIGKTC